MDFLANIDVPFGVIFIFPLLWMVGIGALIIRKNRLNPNDPRSQSVKDSFEFWNGLTSAGPSENPFDVRLDRQLDLGPLAEDDFLKYLRNDDYYRHLRNYDDIIGSY